MIQKMPIKPMEHEDAGCQPAPEGPTLCANNCGFFGSPANMNMCSKCYKDSMLKQEQAKLAASSIENIVNGSSYDQEIGSSQTLQTDIIPTIASSLPSIDASCPVEPSEPIAKQGPKRCAACKKRVGLTGFECRCGDLFCGSHRYSDKHDCPFDYRGMGRDAIAKANPLVKAEKLDKI